MRRERDPLDLSCTVRGGNTVGDQSQHGSDGEDPSVRELVAAASVTYDMFGNGKTALKGSVRHYYKTRETLADNLSGLFTVTRPTYGATPTSGTCTATSC